MWPCRTPSGLPELLDVVGYNYQESRYAADHQKYPKRFIYGSENGGGWAQWLAVRDNDYVGGQFLWTGIDYLGEANRWPNRGSGAGLLDLCGFKKPSAWFRQSLWSDKPMVYLCASAERWWRGTGTRRRLWALWRAGELELALERHGHRPLLHHLPGSGLAAQRQAARDQPSFRGDARRLDLAGPLRTGRAQGGRPQERQRGLRVHFANGGAGTADRTAARNEGIARRWPGHLPPGVSHCGRARRARPGCRSLS